MASDPLEQEIERRVEGLGFELVELERAGSRARPILRLRIDRPGSGDASTVTIDDCAQVSRALEPWLDERPDLPERYVLEVSSPGVERPLVRARDWDRFVGREVSVRGRAPLAGRGRRLDGELLGLEQEDGRDMVRLRLRDGEVVLVPRDEIARAHLIFRWDDAGEA